MFTTLRCFLAACFLGALPSIAAAQTTTVTPNYLGGYRIQTPGQPTTTMSPNYLGGYRIQTPGQPTTTMSPNYLGADHHDESQLPRRVPDPDSRTVSPNHP
jgi:hypothetical protein